MSLTGILLLVIGAIGALIGALGGHAIGKATGKSEGKTEGAQEAEAAQAKAQGTATFEAIKDRLHADQKAAATPDADLDRELSKHDRAD